MLNYDAFRASPTQTDPFPYSVTPGLLPPQALAEAIRDYPRIDMGGLFLPEMASYGPAFANLLKELEGPEVRRIIGQKLNIDLTDRPTMVTLRCNCQAKDGRIHADSKFKVATLLLYLNDDWADNEGGKLRVLRSGTDLEDYAAEVAPQGGLAVCFRVQPNSWHGHKPFIGPRRYVMLNYCTDVEARDREVARHRWSNRVKKFKRLFGIGHIQQKAA
ncbi:2OG-Fe(II) oxygenase [Rhodoblastus sp.]|uniref:2OG-Fe(II) oxygenase family protein n=1 Tax=Rhodoblastus sp. TaxID=1962975 RepID=UPI003F99C025